MNNQDAKNPKDELTTVKSVVDLVSQIAVGTLKTLTAYECPENLKTMVHVHFEFLLNTLQGRSNEHLSKVLAAMDHRIVEYELEEFERKEIEKMKTERTVV